MHWLAIQWGGEDKNIFFTEKHFGNAVLDEKKYLGNSKKLRSVKCKTEGINEFFRSIDNKSSLIIKIDIEGGEIDLLADLDKDIVDRIKLMVVEIWNRHSYQNSKVENFLEKFKNFEVLHLQSNETYSRNQLQQYLFSTIGHCRDFIFQKNN